MSKQENVFGFLKYYHLLLLGIVLVFVFGTRTADAITLNQTTYYVGDPIIVTDPGGLAVLYRLNDNDPPAAQAQNYPGDWNLDYFGISPGNYSVMEFGYELRTDCAGLQLLYEDCKAGEGFIDEFFFTVLPAPEE